jgi:hypothetical protein
MAQQHFNFECGNLLRGAERVEGVCNWEATSFEIAG